MMELCRASRQLDVVARYLNSSVLKWTDVQLVDQAIYFWAYTPGRSHPQILKIGYVGPYTRGDWGVGSDANLLMLMLHSEQFFEQRSGEWGTYALPVPADVLVYAVKKWHCLPKEGRFYQTVAREVRGVFERIENETGNIDTLPGGS